MKQIRQKFGVPAYRGAPVKVRYLGSWRNGVVTSSAGHHVRVRVDGFESQRPEYHPADSENLKWRVWLDAVEGIIKFLAGEEK